MEESSVDAVSSRRSSVEIQQIFEKKAAGPIRLFKRKESRGTLMGSPLSPEEGQQQQSQGPAQPPPTMIVRMPSQAGGGERVLVGPPCTSAPDSESTDQTETPTMISTSTSTSRRDR